MHLLRHRSPTL